MSRRQRPVQVIELDAQSRRALSRRYPELIGFPYAVVVAASVERREPMARAIGELAHAANHGEHIQTERLIEALLPTLEVPKPRVLEVARQQALQRARILRDFGALTATDIAEISESPAANRSQLAYRWRKEGRIFAVEYRGVRYYPGFQFDDAGQPIAAVADVLHALRDWDPWDVASWFVVAHDLLDRHRPLDCLLSGPGEVVAAAQRDATHTAGRRARSGGPPDIEPQPPGRNPGSRE